ncbi:MAG: hypothetical protein AAFV07_13270, partial [Bacteroidota bacterium]
MKRNPFLWSFSWIGFVWLLLAFRPVPPQVGAESLELLYLKDFGLRKNQTTIFSLSVNSGDYLLFDCEDCEILLNRGRISMQLSSPDGAEIIPLTQGLLQNGVRVSGSGIYKLQIKTSRNFVRNAQLNLTQ